METKKIAEAFALNTSEQLFEANGQLFLSANDAKNAFPKAEIILHERAALADEIKAAEAALQKERVKQSEQRVARPSVLTLEVIWDELQLIKQAVSGKAPGKTEKNEPAN